MTTQSGKMRFRKMHGCGNDYVFFDCRENSPPDDLAQFAVRVSNRHTGIGGDGVVLILPSAVADARMQMFNSDGSEGAMCGNAIRCVAKVVLESAGAEAIACTIETKSGVKFIERVGENMRVNMGKAEILGKGLVTEISMGNPHVVIFCKNIKDIEIDKINAIFAEINVEFVQIIARNHIKMRVFERGSGETQACGTGACAATVAACLHGHCDMGVDVLVELVGGDLVVNYTEDAVFMTGACEDVFEGEI